MAVFARACGIQTSFRTFRLVRIVDAPEAEIVVLIGRCRIVVFLGGVLNAVKVIGQLTPWDTLQLASVCVAMGALLPASGMSAAEIVGQMGL